MAEASRALAEAGPLHGFRVDEVHAPFAGEAVSTLRPPAPARDAGRLPGGGRRARRPDPRACARGRQGRARPDVADPARPAPGRRPRGRQPARRRARAVRRPARVRARALAPGRLSAVGEGRAWEAWSSARPSGTPVSRSSARRRPRRCRELMDAAAASASSSPSAFDAECPTSPRRATTVCASSPPAACSEDGPGLFGPTHGSAPDIAGQGVANPSGMLLAAALMLSEGLGERAAGRTLERAITHALADGWRTADLEGAGPAATTRDFNDAVLGLMPDTPDRRGVRRLNGAQTQSCGPWKPRESTPSSASRAARSCRSTTRSRAARRSATCSAATSRAPGTWPRATRGRQADPASRSRPRARARRTSSRRSPTRGWTRPRSSA